MVGSSVGTSATIQVSSQLDQTWRKLTAEARSYTLLRLNEAANLIGFREFHVGWDWNEFPLDRLRKTIHPGGNASNIGEAAESASAAARGFRRREIECAFIRILANGGMGLIATDAGGLSDTVDRIRFLETVTKLRFKTSGVAIRDNNFAAAVFSSEIINLLNSQKAPWKKRQQKHDWFKIERWVRHYFETNGTKLNDQGVMRAYDDASSKSAGLPVEPTRSEFAGLIAHLRREYEYSDE